MPKITKCLSTFPVITATLFTSVQFNFISLVKVCFGFVLFHRETLDSINFIYLSSCTVIPDRLYDNKAIKNWQIYIFNHFLLPPL